MTTPTSRGYGAWLSGSTEAFFWTEQWAEPSSPLPGMQLQAVRATQRSEASYVQNEREAMEKKRAELQVSLGPVHVWHI